MAIDDATALQRQIQKLETDLAALRQHAHSAHGHDSTVASVALSDALGVTSDSTERPKNESEEAWLWNVLDRSLNEIYLFDPETLRFEYANQGALRNLGYSLARLRELSPLDIKPLVTTSRWAELLAPLHAAERDYVTFDTVHERADGSQYPVEVRLQLVDHGRGRVFLAVVNDITEKRNLEAQFLEAQKLESIGRLAGGVAHDFNNLLTVILGYAELLETTGPMRLDDVREIRRAGERARDLTHQLLAFARRQVISPNTLDLNALVHDSSRLMSRLLGEHISVTTELGAGLWLVRVDGPQIGQVLMNLAVNARDAMPEGGNLSIATSNVNVENHAPGNPTLPRGEHVLLTVHDDGCGIPTENLPHVFDPFYTTKAAGEGTGLGLSTVYGIVKQCGGHIDVQSKVGVGTTFRLYFPRAQPTKSATPSALPARKRTRGHESVLVVEDDVTVRSLTARCLADVGYNVLVAESPTDALRLCAEAQGKIDLLLTDIVMPGMSGRQLATQITDAHADVQVLFVSGYARDGGQEGLQFEASEAFLPKPFTPATLLERVRRVLDSA